MNIKTFLVPTIVFNLVSIPAFANWNTAISYANFSDDNGTDISVNALMVDLGYRFRIEDSPVSVTPLLRLGTGVGSDSMSVADAIFEVEIESWAELAVRGAYQITPDVSVFVQPSYGNLKLKAKFEGESLSESDSEFGFGAGVQYQLNSSISFEGVYEAFDDSDVLSVGVRYTF